MLKLVAAIALTGALGAAMPMGLDGDEVQQAFQDMLGQLGADGGGRLSPAELEPIIRAGAPHLSVADVRHTISLMDGDGDGFVTLADFQRAVNEPPPAEVVPIAFRAEDTDGNGQLTQQQALKVAPSLLSGHPQLEHVRYVLQHADADGDGMLEQEEFTAALAALQREA
ncbi:calmodulin-like protein 5 [Pollicipes pollicipes]|uniref:calmodulin-like protein 5 n=1 Tax=Pollicipes pollicipes TaxID=41117 RepID=UPI0018850992|nr:calmodulin-like protein 5 [Pollicipes pollicipes]